MISLFIYLFSPLFLFPLFSLFPLLFLLVPLSLSFSSVFPHSFLFFPSSFSYLSTFRLSMNWSWLFLLRVKVNPLQGETEINGHTVEIKRVTPKDNQGGGWGGQMGGWGAYPDPYAYGGYGYDPYAGYGGYGGGWGGQERIYINISDYYIDWKFAFIVKNWKFS